MGNLKEQIEALKAQLQELEKRIEETEKVSSETQCHRMVVLKMKVKSERLFALPTPSDGPVLRWKEGIDGIHPIPEGKKVQISNSYRNLCLRGKLPEYTIIEIGYQGEDPRPYIRIYPGDRYERFPDMTNEFLELLARGHFNSLISKATGFCSEGIMSWAKEVLEEKAS